MRASTALASALAITTLLTGCGGTAPQPSAGSSSAASAAATGGASAPATPVAGQPSASQVALLYLDAFRGNVAGLKAYNPNSSASEAVFAGINKSTLTSLGITPTDQQSQQVAEAMRRGLAKVEATVVKETPVADGTSVTLSIRGIDLAGSFRKTTGAIDKAKLTEANKAETYVDALATAWQDAPLVDQATNVELLLTYPPGVKSGGLWVPDPGSGQAISKAFVKAS